MSVIVEVHVEFAPHGPAGEAGMYVNGNAAQCFQIGNMYSCLGNSAGTVAGFGIISGRCLALSNWQSRLV